MAKILFTAFMADARGKVAGTVFSKNRSGAYTRTKVTPTNPRTAAQSLQRAQFGSLSAQWAGLSDAERRSWNDGAPNFARTNVFGNVKNLTGQNLFVSLNRNLLNAGEPIRRTCPVPGAMPVWTYAGANFIYLEDTDGSWLSDTSEFSIAGPLPTGFKLLVFVSPFMSPGRETPRTFKLVTPGVPLVPTTVGGQGVYSIGATRLNPLIGTPGGPSKLALRLVVVNTETGEASAAQDVIVTPTFTV